MMRLLPAGILCVNAFAQTVVYRGLWDDPEVTRRIDDGIRANRMGWAALRFVDSSGAPVTNTTIQHNGRTREVKFSIARGAPNVVEVRL